MPSQNIVDYSEKPPVSISEVENEDFVETAAVKDTAADVGSELCEEDADDTEMEGEVEVESGVDDGDEHLPNDEESAGEDGEEEEANDDEASVRADGDEVVQGNDDGESGVDAEEDCDANEDKESVGDDSEKMNGNSEEESVCEDGAESVDHESAVEHGEEVEQCDDQFITYDAGLGGYTYKKFPRSKVAGVKFLMAFQYKYHKVLQDTELKAQIYEDAFNAKFKWAELKSIYERVRPEAAKFEKAKDKEWSRKTAALSLPNKKKTRAQDPPASTTKMAHKKTTVRTNVRTNVTANTSALQGNHIRTTIASQKNSKLDNNTSSKKKPNHITTTTSSKKNTTPVTTTTSSKKKTNVKKNKVTSPAPTKTSKAQLPPVTKTSSKKLTIVKTNVNTNVNSDSTNTVAKRSKKKRSMADTPRKSKKKVKSGMESKTYAIVEQDVSSMDEDKDYDDPHNPSEDDERERQDSQSDSDGNLSINSRGIRNLEIENKSMVDVMKKSYVYFNSNQDGRAGGYGNFPLHLMSYLFHRSLSHKRGNYNPTAKCDCDLFKYANKRGGNPLHHFCCTIMGLSEKDYYRVLRKGNTLHFKRALKHHKKYGEVIEPCENYMKLKKTLKITGW